MLSDTIAGAGLPIALATLGSVHLEWLVLSIVYRFHIA